MFSVRGRAAPTALASLLCGPTAIDRDCRARDLVCRSRTKESHGAAKLRARDKIQRWLLLSQNLLGRFFLTYLLLRGDVADLLFDQRRSHPTRTDRIASDAAASRLQSDHLGQADQPVLGRNIGGLVC